MVIGNAVIGRRSMAADTFANWAVIKIGGKIVVGRIWWRFGVRARVVS
jgi:hypothetical protein